MWSKMLPPGLGTCRPPFAVHRSGGMSFMAHIILSTLWQACSTSPSPESHTKFIQFRSCHSKSLMPSRRVSGAGIGLTGPVRYVW